MLDTITAQALPEKKKIIWSNFRFWMDLDYFVLQRFI